MLTIGVDTGGTFTDFIYASNGRTGTYKTLSTPHNPAEAVLRGLAHIAGDAAADMSVVHGSTVATNAILERKGVRTALVTNARFTDVIEIGRQNRTRLYDLAYRRQPHIVPPKRRFGAPGRVASSGEEIEPFDEDAAREVVRAVRAIRRTVRGRLLPVLLPGPGATNNAWGDAGRTSACPYPCPTKSCRNSANSSAPRPRWSTPMSRPS